MDAPGLRDEELAADLGVSIEEVRALSGALADEGFLVDSPAGWRLA
jgi:DNA-binding GntR family transcriptional regulator